MLVSRQLFHSSAPPWYICARIRSTDLSPMDTNLYFLPCGVFRGKHYRREEPHPFCAAFDYAQDMSKRYRNGGPVYLYYANGFPAFVVTQAAIRQIPPVECVPESRNPPKRVSRTVRAYLRRMGVSSDGKFLVEYQNSFGERMNEPTVGFKHAAAFALDRVYNIGCHAFVFAILPGGASPPRTRNGKIRAARYSTLMLRRDGASPLHSGDPWIIPVAHVPPHNKAPTLTPWDGGPWWRDPIRRPTDGPQYS